MLPPQMETVVKLKQRRERDCILRPHTIQLVTYLRPIHVHSILILLFQLLTKGNNSIHLSFDAVQKAAETGNTLHNDLAIVLSSCLRYRDERSITFSVHWIDEVSHRADDTELVSPEDLRSPYFPYHRAASSNRAVVSDVLS